MIAPKNSRGDVADDERDDESVIDPTPELIRQRARAIRQGWSEKTRKRRRVTAIATWTVPTIHLDDVERNSESVGER